MPAAYLRLLRTAPDPGPPLIRLMVGLVFFSEGIQKFLFPAIRGAGRFEKIGLPSPDMLGTLVGSLEILCGLLVLLGLLTRYAVIPLIVIMLVAIFTTKIPLLSEEGLWAMLHAWRTDLSMLIGSTYLLLKGGGNYSLDRNLFSREK